MWIRDLGFRFLDTCGCTDAEGGQHEGEYGDSPERKQAGRQVIGGAQVVGQGLSQVDHDAHGLQQGLEKQLPVGVEFRVSAPARGFRV